MEKNVFSGSTSKSSHPQPAAFLDSNAFPHFDPASETNHEFAFLGGDRTPFLASGLPSAAAGISQSSPGVGVANDPLLDEVDAFPSWGSESNVPITIAEIKQIAFQLQMLFQFQEDNARNMCEYFMWLLESRALRMGPFLALRSLHGDYIGGENANYRKWYFATEMDSEDLVRLFNGNSATDIKSKQEKLLSLAESQWKRQMAKLDGADYAAQVLLYLLVWGEAGNLRFMPECICFIYKCCIDYYYGYDDQQPKAEKPFLDHVITPLYLVLRLQSYSGTGAELTHVDRDHSSIIGYDDMNQLFWHRKEILKIKVCMQLGTEPLLGLLRPDRYLALGFVLWDRVFLKTYREYRTWMHVVVNFNRVLNIHLALFWIFTAYNLYPLYTPDYDVNFDNSPVEAVRITIISLCGALLTIVSIIATLCEMRFAPRLYPGSYPVFGRLCALTFLLAANVAPTIVLYAYKLSSPGSQEGLGLAIIHLVLGLLTCLYLTFASPSKLFWCKLKGRSNLATKSFTACFHPLNGTGDVISVCLWLGVFTLKLVESYFFLAIPLRAPIRELSAMQTLCVGDGWFGALLCRFQPLIVLVLVFFLELVLYFLDTYLWYVVWNTAFSVAKSLQIGSSIWTPWRNVYARLPKRIYSRLLVPTNHKSVRRQSMVARIWNLIIVAMYRDHFLSIEQVQKLLYDIEGSGQGVEPAFFVAQEDSAQDLVLFVAGSEAKRRIAFFAQSLTLPMPEAREIKAMPSFSVLIPHYSEKIILLLKEIVQEEDKHTHVTLLEYLKLLYPLEWQNFVSDTMIMAQEEPESGFAEKEDPLFQAVGFKEATPVFIMRTRIWALLRAQTLYRTVFGFMNYLRAIKTFYDLEMGAGESFMPAEEKIKHIHRLTCRKFRIVVAMQRYRHFSSEELDCVDVLLSGYPEVQIAYIDEDFDETRGEVAYYSCLIDGTCTKLAGKGREPKLRIRLPGYPILGDGKADNQNHALVFTRGEYLQLIDANQDNYLEECLKIRSVLAEFEEQAVADPYDNLKPHHPVAIVGTREYIFSENTGILGDIAAGKEQTFGTLFARTLSQIGGKLHYGHPDFLNAVFMTTRGGVSKAQKSLHLNEDIYAGMTALTRGGRIKHCEYMQCGKGRDLGFTSIANFITKIGAGMGEQILSREYFYLGTQLRLDWLLSFYYAHLGFHLNNYLIIFSIQLFLVAGVNIAALTHESIVCEISTGPNLTPEPPNCRNLIPVVQWLERTVKLVFFVFVLSLLPLAVHEIAERGIYRAISRTSKHILSFLPVFEVFVCRIYAHALGSDLAVGGAQYIATGRGFATKREKFADLYTRFGHALLNFGVFVLLLVTYFSVSIWLYAYIFFWLTVSGFLFAPFLFNPGQFDRAKFVCDYMNFFWWLFAGNSSQVDKTWIEYIKIERSRLTGVKLAMCYGADRIKNTNVVRPGRWNVLVTVVVPKVVSVGLIACAYLFANSQNDTGATSPTYAAARVLIVAGVPLLFNLALMLVVFLFNITLGWLLTLAISVYPFWVSCIARISSVCAHFLSLAALWQFQNYDFGTTVLGIALICKIQSTVLQTITVIFLSREVMDPRPNRAWWLGQWLRAGLGWHTFTQPLREYVCKVAEQTHFASDFMTGHLIFFAQAPLLLIPLCNTWHSVMLMWMRPDEQLRHQPPNSSLSKRKVAVAAVTFASAVLVMGALIAGIVMIPRLQWLNIGALLPKIIKPLTQPILEPELIPRGLRKELYEKASDLTKA